MKALMYNSLLAMEISQATLIVLMAVLIVLIILLAVLATIFILGVKRKNTTEIKPITATVFAQFDESLGTVVIKDGNDEQKSLFATGDTVRVFVKANEGYRFCNICAQVDENVVARFTADNSERAFCEGVYEFTVVANTIVKAEFEIVEEPAAQTVTFTEEIRGTGGRVIFGDEAGEERTEFLTGETVRISAVADEGYYLAYFAIDGEEKEPVEGVYEFVVTQPVSVCAEFMKIEAPKYRITVETNGNGAVKATNVDNEEQTEFAQGETVVIDLTAGEGCYLSRLTVDGEEKELAPSYRFVVDSDMTVVAQFDVQSVAEEVAADADEDEDEDEVMFDGHNVIRFNKSFTAKVIQSDDVANSWYTELKNELLSYKKVKDRMSWKRESYRLGKVCVARFVIRGKTLCIQLPLDPAQYEDTKYKVEDISHVMSSADTPCLYRIKNERRLNYAKDLIAQVMENMGAVRIEREWVDYYQPYDTTLNLIERQLVKKVVKFNGKTGYGGIVEKLTEDPTKVNESEDEAAKE